MGVERRREGEREGEGLGWGRSAKYMVIDF